jgi:hypothetical protein
LPDGFTNRPAPIAAVAAAVIFAPGSNSGTIALSPVAMT